MQQESQLQCKNNPGTWCTRWHQAPNANEIFLLLMLSLTSGTIVVVWVQSKSNGSISYIYCNVVYCSKKTEQCNNDPPGSILMSLMNCSRTWGTKQTQALLTSRDHSRCPSDGRSSRKPVAPDLNCPSSSQRILMQQVQNPWKGSPWAHHEPEEPWQEPHFDSDLQIQWFSAPEALSATWQIAERDNKDTRTCTESGCRQSHYIYIYIYIL